MEIHFQTTDHVVAVEKVAEQQTGTKYSKRNSLRVRSHIIILGKSAITHSKVGQSSPNPKNIEQRKNSQGPVIYQNSVTVVVSEKTAWYTHAHTHMHGANYNLPPASRAGDNIKSWQSLAYTFTWSNIHFGGSHKWKKYIKIKPWIIGISCCNHIKLWLSCEKWCIMI